MSQTIDVIKAVAKLIGTSHVRFGNGVARLEADGIAVEISSKDTRGVRGQHDINELEAVWAELRRLSEARQLLESMGYRVYRRGANSED